MDTRFDMERGLGQMNESARPGRAGNYVRQPEGYSAFSPRPLPPDPPITIGEEMLDLLSRAYQALGGLDGSIRTLPHTDLFVSMYIRKEAVLSSQIEGTQSSLQDLLAAEARIHDPERPRDVGEVINYVRAMNYGLERLDGFPVSVQLICEIHAELLKGGRGSKLTPGQVRENQNWIGPPGCSPYDATFIPPPPHKVIRHLEELEAFMRSESPLPLLMRVGLVHAQFETIHPFRDGNGRIGRLLIAFMLCSQEVLCRPVLYLSYYFKKYQQTYYGQLQSVRDRGTWEDWLMFFLRGVAEVGEQAAETARRILDLRERHRAIITERFGRTAGNGHRVLEHLYEHPIISVNQVKVLIGTEHPAANRLVSKLVDNRILKEVTGQVRNRLFVYQRYIELFHENVDEVDW